MYTCRQIIVNLFAMCINGFIRLCFTLLLSVFSTLRIFAGQSFSEKDSLNWQSLVKKEYTLHFTETDKSQLISIDNYLQSGFKHIADFFHHSFPDKLDVYIFPNRKSLDKQWQKDWSDSTFQSECWMIASGVAHRMDILSPNVWLKESCDHNASDSTEIRKVIWHELTHVFNGQYNPDHAFNYIEKLDWLVEGVATYVSGQLDGRRLQRIKQLIQNNNTPATLDEFWKGQEKYGLSGSIVAFIDNKYGREKLFALLKQTNKQDALKLLGLPEEQLLKSWRESF